MALCTALECTVGMMATNLLVPMFKGCAVVKVLTSKHLVIDMTANFMMDAGMAKEHIHGLTVVHTSANGSITDHTQKMAQNTPAGNGTKFR